MAGGDSFGCGQDLVVLFCFDSDWLRMDHRRV